MNEDSYVKDHLSELWVQINVSRVLKLCWTFKGRGIKNVLCFWSMPITYFPFIVVFKILFTRLRDITLISVSKYFYVFEWYVHVCMFYVWYVHVLPACLCVEARGNAVCLL